jgi:hypothetical protein
MNPCGPCLAAADRRPAVRQVRGLQPLVPRSRKCLLPLVQRSRKCNTLGAQYACAGFRAPVSLLDMTTGAHLRFVLAPHAGVHPATFDRFLNNLSAAGLARRSGAGRGRAVVDLMSIEIASVMLSLATPHSNEAAKAARSLGGLFPENPQEGDASLRTTLADTIETMAMLLQRGSSDLGDPDFELILCLNPLRATMAWPSRGPAAVRRFFDYTNATTIAPATQPAPLFRRDTVITQPLLVAVARLYAGINEDADSPGREPALPANHPIREVESSDGLDSPESTAPACDFSTLARSPPPCPVIMTTLIG